MAINVLPESQRETMLLVAIERFSYEEAATILQLPVGEVIKRISQARQTIGALRISCPLNE